MDKNNQLYLYGRQIEKRRKELNEMMINNKVRMAIILNKSMELDKLITLYYQFTV